MKKHEILPSNWLFQTDDVSNVVFVKELFSSNECDEIIKYCKKFSSEEAKTDAGIIHKIRKSNIVWVPNTKDSSWIYERLGNSIKELNNKYFKFKLTGIVEALQFTHYKAPDGKYVKHQDKIPNGTIRKLSASVQLTDPKKYKGGELLLHQSEIPTIALKEKGSLTLFPSYTLHEVIPVTKGERYSLVSWIHGEPFV